ncbi:hypothetical protein F4805DRAFT_184334 [Annulohypoxylon moriforme]|nr:hypothetical protein F4805DRAFT_184334 [Annulohypoxylon moriforme]
MMPMFISQKCRARNRKYGQKRASTRSPLMVACKSFQIFTVSQQGYMDNGSILTDLRGRGPYDFPVSIEESCDTEQSEIHKSRQETGTRFLHITYDVPKAVIELDPDCLELTEQCKRDATGVTNITGLDHFYRQYGTIFVTRSTLGGYLNNTRNVGILSKFELDQMKDEIRIAVRTSMQASINRSGSADIVKMNTKVKKNDNTFPPQDILLAWDVHGGDTLLFPNMAAWTGSVKDHRLWRLMDQRGLVSLKYLIYDVDSIVWSQLHNLPPENYACNIALEDVFGALKLEKHIPSWMALAGDREDYPITKQIVAYYRNGRYDTADRIKLYNDFIKANFKHNAPAIISPHSLYGDLSMARKIGFGIYMIKKGELKFDYLPPGTSHTRFW